MSNFQDQLIQRISYMHPQFHFSSSNSSGTVYLGLLRCTAVVLCVQIGSMFVAIIPALHPFRRSSSIQFLDHRSLLTCLLVRVTGHVPNGTYEVN
jgi:hypothetical protein